MLFAVKGKIIYLYTLFTKIYKVNIFNEILIFLHYWHNINFIELIDNHFIFTFDSYTINIISCISQKHKFKQRKFYNCCMLDYNFQ